VDDARRESELRRRTAEAAATMDPLDDPVMQ
jgi:hypothetical protein